jgi:hypothetical protein
MPTTTTDIRQLATKSPEQMQVLNSIMSQLSPELLQRLMGDEQQFRDRFQKTTVDPAMQNFQQQVIPQLQEVFAGSGSKGGDVEARQLAGAGQQLSTDLGRLFEESFGQEQQQQRGFASNLAQLGLGTSPFENVATQRTKTDPFESFLSSLGKTAGSALTGGVSDIIASFFPQGGGNPLSGGVTEFPSF